ncbi:MAG: hypothetical protein ACRDJY_07945 [Thermoleophilaceae bacterium]
MLFVASLAAGVVLALPQVALAQESAAVGTVYDKGLYETLVRKGMARDEARCASALSGATVRLERRTDAYFLPVDADDPAIAPNVNPQKTDVEGSYGWIASEGDYRVAVTKPGYWRLFSSTVSDTSAVLDLDLPLKRRPGTPPPKPRDCAPVVDEPEPMPEPLPEPEPEPEPEPTDPPDHEPQENDDEPEPAAPTCQFRPVNAGVRGQMVRRVVFTLDGRVIKRLSRPDSDGRFGIVVERRSLARGKHLLKAKVVFVRRAKRAPELLRLAIRRCPERAAPKLVTASPARCSASPFLAWVRGYGISSVSFRIDGRVMKTVSVANWRGRYGVTVRPGRLSRGRHVVAARIEFVKGSHLKQRTVRLRFRHCA